MPVALVAAVGVIACGGSRGTGGDSLLNAPNPFEVAMPAKASTDARCDFRGAPAGHYGEGQCRDIRQATQMGMDWFKELCESPPALFTSHALCGSAQMIGGCQTVGFDRSVTTTWYYRGARFQTAEQVRQDCESRQTFVGPRS